jgi:hypothetical protein
MGAPAGGENPVRDFAFSGVVFASRCAKCPPGVDLIRSPRRVAVLSDFWAGTTSQAGDLFLSLEGLGGKDRGCNAAQTLGRFSGTATLTFCALDKAEVDSLVTIREGRFAELSTMPLRWRPLGRCAASWITSGMVSGGESTLGNAQTLDSPDFTGATAYPSNR